MPDILLSIHPNYIARMRSGVKTIEIRKGGGWGFRPKRWSRRIFIYATAPVCGVVAYFDCPLIERISLLDVLEHYWPECGVDNSKTQIAPRLGVTRYELYKYAGYTPCSHPSPTTPLCLLHMGPVNWFPEPIPLPYRGVTRAPQNFAYLNDL
jgi:hypothetical protein